MLHSYDVFQLIPEPGTVLCFSKCAFTTNTLLFFHMCPYVNKSSIMDLFSLTAVKTMPAVRPRIEMVLAALRSEAENGVILSAFRQILMLMELTGYFGLCAETCSEHSERP